MIDILYTLIIFPIEQVIEICFFYGKAWFGNVGIAIIGVSVAVSTFVLPIRLMAEKRQRRQREIEKSLKDGVDRIKSVFKGYKRFMLLSTYYRQNNYHPIFALRNNLDLLIQIPFFIAAYHFMYDLDALNGVKFLFIANLGRPDALLFNQNILPIAMAAINIVSGMIYAKDLTERDRIQLYLVSVVFLVLLYDSPAGLALYWTSNNIYNLVRNIIQNNVKNKKREERKEPTVIKDNALNDSRAFVLATLALALLIGLVIPSGVILSGVDEFSYSTVGMFVSPFRFIVHTILQAGGFFLWGICLYFLFQGKARAILTTAAVSLLIMSAMDTFVYWGNYGFLTKELVLSSYKKTSAVRQCTAITVIIALSAVAYFLMNIKRKQIIISILAITVISFAVFGITDIVKTNAAITDVKKRKTASVNVLDDNQADVVEKAFKLSKNGKNVIILMMDRLQSQHIPFIFDEKPELVESFRGFTYYPNMVSPGAHTFYAAPALFGGYYYTPDKIQKRVTQPLKDKYNESLQVIPRMMAQNNVDVSVTNLPFIDESEAFAKQIFSDVENIEVTDIIDKYRDSYINGHLPFKIKDYNPIVKKNLFQFSLVKCSPYIIRASVYNNGGYMNVDMPNKHSAINLGMDMLKNYLSLLFYPQMTEITDDYKNNCVIAVNDIAHTPVILQYPSYHPVENVTNSGNGLFSNDPQYHVTMLSFLLISKWFDYLRENGVWDNSKIIVVSDHGFYQPTIKLPVNITLPDGYALQRFNNLLMIKDFGVSKELSVDAAFMTSADIPTIAAKDIIDNPKNPFTSEPFNTEKDSGVVITTVNWKPMKSHGKYTYDFKNNEWMKVKEDIFKKENWTMHSIEK